MIIPFMSKFLKIQYPLQLWWNNPILRVAADYIYEITPEIRNFAYDLLDLMRLYEGVWLAAPQVGKSWRIIATTQRKSGKRGEKNTGEIVMINPEIIEYSSEIMASEEACLSLPWEQWVVRRYKQITVSYLDPEARKHTRKFESFNAAIIQHEIDHLDGILFIDKLVAPKKL